MDISNARIITIYSKDEAPDIFTRATRDTNWSRYVFNTNAQHVPLIIEEFTHDHVSSLIKYTQGEVDTTVVIHDFT